MVDRHASDSIRERFATIRQWKKGGKRAPHKPLLLLMALGRLQRKDSRYLLYADVDRELSKLLREFGGAAKSDGTQYPFSRLRNDADIWVFDREYELPERKSNNDPKKSALLDQNVAAGFSPDVYEALSQDPALVVELARDLLDEHFAPSMHEDLLAAVGLTMEIAGGSRKKASRDRAFREAVLRAYEYRCAVCGFQVQFDGQVIGLEAAHIHWHSHQGADVVPNGICMCAIHHKYFDRGIYTLSPESYVMELSTLACGGSSFDEWFRRFEGQAIRTPRHPELAPASENLEWHRRQVFHSRGIPKAL